MNGNGTTSAIKLALQLRAEIGVKGETDLIPIPGLPDVGAGAELGVFVNLIELNGQVGEDPTLFNGTCLLAAQENFGLSVGAFLNLDVEVGAKTFGAVPTVSTTLFAGPSATQCLVSRGQVLPTRGPINTAPSVVCTDSLPFASATAAPVPVPVQTPRGGIGVSIVVPLPPAQRPTAAPYNPYPYSPYAGRRLAKRSPVSLRPLLAEASNATVALATGNGQAPVPTMLSTTTVTLTVCNYPGAIICPATAQSVVTAVATQTVTLAVCPPTPPALSPSSSVDSCAAAIRAAQSTTPAAALTSLASPIVATLAPRPTSPTNTTVPSFSGNNTSDLTITTTATIVVQPSPVPIDFANSVVGSVVVVPVGAGGGAAQGTAAALVPTAAARDAQPFTGAAAGRADVGTVGRVVAVAVGGIIASAVLTGGW